MQSDSSLVKAVLTGELQAFAELVRRYQRVVLLIAWKSLRDRHAIEDVAQQAFFSAYQNLGDLRDPALFGSWLMRIVQREALRFHRERRNEYESLENDVVAIGSLTAPVDHNEQLVAAMARLPEHQRIVVTLHYLDGLSVKCISEITGRSVGTVTKQISRAIFRLRETLLEPSR